MQFSMIVYGLLAMGVASLMMFGATKGAYQVIRGIGSTDPAKPGLVQQFRRLDTRQRLQFFAALIAFATVVYVTGKITDDSRKDVLREHFHLPADITFSGYRSNHKSGWLPRIEGIVEFGEDDFNAYRAKLVGGDSWTPGTVYYSRTAIAPDFSSRALQWQELKDSGSIKTRISWGYLLQDKVASTRSGRLFCYQVIQVNPPKRFNLWDDLTKYNYIAAPCGDFKYTDTIVSTIKAVLDYDKRTLYMQVN